MPVKGGEDYQEERSMGSQREYDRAARDREDDRRRRRDGDQDREARLAAMGKGGTASAAPSM
jgi:hypothetical protein